MSIQRIEAACIAFIVMLLTGFVVQEEGPTGFFVVTTGKAVSEGSFTISNFAPDFSGQLPNQSWNTSNKIGVFDLDNYFSDRNGEALSFSATGNVSITITINGDHTVDFQQATGFTGTEEVVFSASDGNSVTYSNTITLTVSALCGDNIIEGSEFCDGTANNCTSGYSCASNCTTCVAVVADAGGGGGGGGGSGGSSGGTSGGSGGGGPSAKPNIVEPLSSGETITIRLRDNIRIMIGNKEYFLNLAGITREDIQMGTNGGPIIMIKKGEKAEFDLDNDGNSDAQVTLDSIDGTLKRVTITLAFFQTVRKPDQEALPEEYTSRVAGIDSPAILIQPEASSILEIVVPIVLIIQTFTLVYLVFMRRQLKAQKLSGSSSADKKKPSRVGNSRKPAPIQESHASGNAKQPEGTAKEKSGYKTEEFLMHLAKIKLKEQRRRERRDLGKQG